MSAIYLEDDMTEISISEALTAAVDTMPRLRRSTWKMRLASKRFRDRMELELADKLADNSECCALVPAFATYASSDSFAVDGRFQIDPANLERFLQIILEYLPQILELIFKFFVVLVAAALVLFSSSAQAQQPLRQMVAGANKAAVTIATPAVHATAGVAAAVINGPSMRQHARQMNATGVIQHSGAPRENIYWSSDGANRFEARRAWRQSPAHAANLRHIVPVLGVRCAGGVCVARGR